MQRLVVRVLALFAVLSLLGALGFADDSPKTPAGAKTSLRGGAPRREYAARVALKFGKITRTMDIHREQESKTDWKAGQYFHRPLWLLVKSEKPRFPTAPIVHEVDATTDRDGNIKLTFQVQLTTPEYKDFCRAAVLKSDLGYVTSRGGTAADVRVDGWPLEHAIIECKVKGEQTLLAIGQTDSLKNVDDYLEFKLAFSPENLKTFLELSASNNVQFVFYYSYTGSITYGGSAELQGSKSVAIESLAEFSSAQREGKAPIFQGDREKLTRALRNSVTATIRLQHKDLFPIVEGAFSALIGKVFEPNETLTFEELKKGYSGVEAQLAAYLKPLLETSLVSEGRQETVTTTNEEQRGSSGGFNGGFGIAIGPVSLGIGGHTEGFDKVIKRLENASGVTFQKVEGKEQWAPHEISVTKLRTGWQTQTFDLSTTAFLSVGEDQNYLFDTPVPSNFTVDVASQQMATEVTTLSTLALTVHPIGSYLEYAGTDPKLFEPTWLVCDGRPLKKTDYPVLQQAIQQTYGVGTPRSKDEEAGDFNLPDLRGRFLRGFDSTGTVDPDVSGKPRVLGSVQEDALQLHGHLELGGHTHRVEVNNLDRMFFVEGRGGIISNGNQWDFRSSGGAPINQTFIPLLPQRLSNAHLVNGLHPGDLGYATKESPRGTTGSALTRDPQNPAETVSVFDPLKAEGKTANFATETRPKNVAAWVLIRAR